MIQDHEITLAHGNGGRYMRELITDIFAHYLGTDHQVDAITLPWIADKLVVTTDGFTVQPLEFPGGNIGSLAVHGTVNDLAVMGAVPHYLTLSAIIEEGLTVSQLGKIIQTLGQTVQELGILVVAGDTKVVPRGEGSGLYLAMTGLGSVQTDLQLGLSTIQSGDRVLVSGPIGDHGTAVLLARQQFGLQGEVRSDSASVLPLTETLLSCSGLRFMRDPTRGGLATVAHEISHATGYTLYLQHTAIPIRPSVQSVCDLLGFDPLYLACEGRVVAVVAEDQAELALAKWRALPGGSQAALIGNVQLGTGQVILQTEIGGERLLEELESEPLPRIC